jgi:hypothetical protein
MVSLCQRVVMESFEDGLPNTARTAAGVCKQQKLVAEDPAKTQAIQPDGRVKEQSRQA